MIATAGTASEKDFYSSARDRSRQLISYVRPGSYVVDLGCGIGRFERFLAPSCGHITGVDPTPGFIRIAKRENSGAPNAEFRVGTGFDLRGLPSGGVDFLFALGVFERLPKPLVQKYLHEIHRTLTGDGRAYLEFLAGTRTKIVALDGFAWDSVVYKIWDPQEVVDVVKASGFILEKLETDPPVLTVIIRKDEDQEEFRK